MCFQSRGGGTPVGEEGNLEGELVGDGGGEVPVGPLDQQLRGVGGRGSAGI